MDWSRDSRIQDAADLLRRGEIIAYPTEAVWGLGCDPQNEQAVLNLLALKQRDYEKGMILVAADMEQFADYLRPLTAPQRQLLSESWPGPHTWIVPDLEHHVPQWVRGQYHSVALRVSAHPLVTALCQAFGGPIVSTSANPQGQPPALQAEQVQGYFGDRVAMITPGSVGAQDKPTQIRDLITGQVVRAS
jgi:L-threonylcarbamoyladenylate synthase